MEPNKRQMALLERCWLAEVCDQLPAQIGKSKNVEKLVAEGYLQPMETVSGGRFPVTVKGHQLTHLGRLTYCASC